MSVNVIEGKMIPMNSTFAIVAARWNEYIVNSLVEGAVSALANHDVPKDNISVIRCPGAYEIPLVAQNVAKQKRFNGIIALGAVIRGSTAHFEYVAGECASGISKVMLEYNIPISFGVLTVDSIEQAIERAGSKMGNKGTEAALCAIEMVNLLKTME